MRSFSMSQRFGPLIYPLLFVHSERWSWSIVPTGGTVPSPRAGHTATQRGSMMYVFGGGTGWNGQTFNDLFVLDTTAMVWYK